MPSVVRMAVAILDVLIFSGPQKGPAERGDVKKRQNSSKSVKNVFDTFRHLSRRAKSVKSRQNLSASAKVSHKRVFTLVR